MDNYFTLYFGTPSEIPAQFEVLFNSGTKPSEWTIAPPSKEELTRLLAGQLSRISDIAPESLKGKLQSPFVSGPIRFETVGELINFGLMHEAIHSGVISSQMKLVGK